MDQDDLEHGSLIISKRCIAREFEGAREMIVFTYARHYDRHEMDKSNMLLIPTKPFKPLPNRMISIYKQSILNRRTSIAIKTFSRINWTLFHQRLKTKIGRLVTLEPAISQRTKFWFLEVYTTMAIMFVKSGCDVVINPEVVDKLKTYSEDQINEYMHTIYAVHDIPHYVHFSLGHIVG